MSKVILFIKDLKLGTEVSNQIVQNDHEVVFFDEGIPLEEQIVDSVAMAILNLDDQEYGTVHFISTLRMLNRKIRVVGYMKHVQKLKHEKLKAAGASMILPKASMSKNISTFLDLL